MANGVRGERLMKVTIAQLNPIIGDIKGNIKKITTVLEQCNQKSPDLVIFPELFIVGYPPRDLLERPRFIRNVQEAIESLIEISKGYPQMGILFGAPQPTENRTGRGLYNSALLIYQGRLLFKQSKTLLPNYDVFDEARYFDMATQIDVVSFKDELLGISICEDAWNDEELWPKRYYPFDPLEVLAKKGATMFINISASPFHIGKEEVRFRIFRNHAKKHHVPFVFVNQIGGNDELIFDGRSMVIDKKGDPIDIFPSFKEYVKTIDMCCLEKPCIYTSQDPIESVYEALVLGLHDYMQKCGFSKAIIGVSGGIDSAVVCCLAKDAIGSQNVLGVTMPGPFSSKGSVKDSEKLAQNLDIPLKTISI
jgi:NAD+ synthase (glutamine-hydrolysing)